MSDGSIRSDLKMPLGIYAMYFITTGFMNRVPKPARPMPACIRLIRRADRTAFEMLDQLLRK
jgi:hypothetical protein